MSWKKVPLSSLIELITKGTTPTSVGYDFTDSGINFVKIESINLNGNFIKNKFAKIDNECNEALKRSQLKEGDILFSIAGALGRTAIVTKEILPANTNQALAIIRLKDNNLISKEFLIRVLTSKSILNQVSLMKGGVAQQNLSLAQLKDFLIPLPPIATQQKIVAKIDAIFAEIDTATAAAEANAKNAEALFQSYLTEIFEHDREGWSKKKISEIAKIKGGKRVPKGYELKNEITPYVYLRVTNFSENGDIDTTDLRYVDSDVWNGIKNYIIESEDLYVSIAGTIGRTGMVSEQLSGSLLTENACRLVFNNDINNRFVYYFTKSSSFISQTVEQTRTTAQPKLALSRLGEITLAIPSLDEQLEINKKLDLMTSQISIYKNSYEQKIIELNALKQAILQKAFSGELVKE